ncbi:MAG: hypothetical protein EA402_08880 [Planctomycetota bacterium]|nr:MAG: hypothetical protein EA402_08880 [Planctomycetota bacterium]
MALDTLLTDPWWTAEALPDEGCAVWQLGRLSLYARRMGPDLAIGSRLDDEELSHAVVGSLSSVPEDITAWPRWVTGVEQPRLRLLPVLPSLPVVIRPYQPITLGPHMKVRIYVGLPCLLQVAVLGADHEAARTLLEIESVPLSQTWFGEPVAGELALSLRSRARRHLGDIDHLAHRILCPVEISNQHHGDFSFERAFVRLAHCGVYHGADRLFSSAIHLNYRGPEHEVEMEVENHPPAEAATALLLQAPRNPSGVKGSRGVLAGLRGAWMTL